MHFPLQCGHHCKLGASSLCLESACIVILHSKPSLHLVLVDVGDETAENLGEISLQLETSIHPGSQELEITVHGECCRSLTVTVRNKQNTECQSAKTASVWAILNVCRLSFVTALCLYRALCFVEA